MRCQVCAGRVSNPFVTACAEGPEPSPRSPRYAAPTCTGERVLSPIGVASPVPAHIPAWLIGPGNMTETPTPWAASSPRSDNPKLANADLVALYTVNPGVGKAAASEETDTTWPFPLVVIGALSNRDNSIGARRLTSMARSSSSNYAEPGGEIGHHELAADVGRKGSDLLLAPSGDDDLRAAARTGAGDSVAEPASCARNQRPSPTQLHVQ